MHVKTGALLVNLGTPNSPAPRDVYRYLIEFLTDERVIDLPWLYRQLLVRGVIVPMRYRQSAAMYKEVWTPEGSPLKVYGEQVKQKLQNALGSDYAVELAMRYQSPSIQGGIQRLIESDIKHLIVLPLFPQYASATTGSVNQKVMEVLKGYNVIPSLTLINNFATQPTMIKAFGNVARQFPYRDYDHILFSFHGLPQRHLRKADRCNHCLSNPDCCQKINTKNSSCYSAQCYSTAQAIAHELGIAQNQYSICFQSRLGKDPWLEPYTSATIAQLAQMGHRKLLVICPSFVCDCLETLFEIGVEYAHEFKQAGGETLDLVPGLNDNPLWIDALKEIVTQ